MKLNATTVAIALAMMIIHVSPGAAQHSDRPWGFLSSSADVTSKPEVAPPLDLRANVPIPVYLYLVNPTDDQPTVSAQVMANGVAVASVATVKLPGNTVTRVNLTAIAGSSSKGNPPADGLIVNPDPKNKRLAFRVNVSNQNRPDTAGAASEQVLSFLSPSNYLGETAASVAGSTGELTVNVRANNFQGPPCHVQLVLSPDEIPGLQLTTLKGVLRATLTAEQPNATLVASGFSFAPGSKGEGRLSLTVDGIDRAVVMSGNFRPQTGATSEPFRIEPKRGLSLIAPNFAKPGEAVTVKLEATNLGDNVPVTFTVSPGSVNVGAPVQTQTRTGAREHKALLKVNDDGAIEVTTVVKDWTFPFDTRSLHGPVTVKATVSAGGETRDVSRIITFDDTPPQNISILPFDPMKPPIRARMQTIRTRGSDDESRIVKVEYFVGVEPPLPGADGKIPAEPKPITAVLDSNAPKDSDVWMANINLPEKKGILPVFARYTNGVGLSTVAKFEFDVLDPPYGSVKGQVVYGDKPQSQNVTVWLMSKDGKTIVKDTKVDAKANFEIKDIPAGEYILVAEQKAAAKPVNGATSVTIAEGPVATTKNIQLKK